MFAQLEQDEDELQRFRDLARCNDGVGSMVGLFFSEQLDDIARAKAICAKCPVREECFEGAVARRTSAASVCWASSTFRASSVRFWLARKFASATWAAVEFFD